MKFVKQEIKSWISTNITQDYLDYNPLTTYIFEDIGSASNGSVCAYKGYYWRSICDDNTGNIPTDTEGIFWNKWKVANVTAMLDEKSMSATETNYTSLDADYNSSDDATDIAVGSLVWDTDNHKMYESLDSTNDLPNSDFSNETLWKNLSDIIVTFSRSKLMNTIGLGYLEASRVIIEQYYEDGTQIDFATQIIVFNQNIGVDDVWAYGYTPYSTQIGRGLYIKLKPIGSITKVTVVRQSVTYRAKCGFLIAGRAIDMGHTLDKVNFSFNSFSSSETDQFGNLNIIKRSVQNLIDFETIIDRKLVMSTKREIKSNYDNIIMFIIDTSEDSDFENMVTLGKISNASLVGETSQKNVISWSIFESI